MQFTGKNLLMVRQGIRLAISEIHNEIATCPDVVHYAYEIEGLKEDKRAFKDLLARIDLALVKERQPASDRSKEPA